jgi:hypothetical protein
MNDSNLLGYKLARNLSIDEINAVAGGQPPNGTPTGTVSSNAPPDCDSGDIIVACHIK